MVHRSSATWYRTAVALAAIVVAVVLPACGPGPDGGEVTERRASVEPEMGEPAGDLVDVFDDLPRVPESQPLTSREEGADSVARTFEATGRTPEQVLSFYEDELDGDEWTVTSPPGPAGEGAWRGEWTGHGATLVVSASRQPADDRERPSQYSLTLKTIVGTPTPG